MNPGEAGFLYNTARTNTLLTFAGTILQSTVSNTIPGGYSLVSPMIPLPGAISTFPAQGGDQIQFFENKKWNTYTYISGRWALPGPKYTPIVFSPGRAFFISKKSPGVWTQSY